MVDDCTKAQRLEETKTARKSTSRTTNNGLGFVHNKKLRLIDIYDGDDEDDEDDEGDKDEEGVTRKTVWIK